MLRELNEEELARASGGASLASLARTAATRGALGVAAFVGFAAGSHIYEHSEAVRDGAAALMDNGLGQLIDFLGESADYLYSSS